MEESLSLLIQLLSCAQQLSWHDEQAHTVSKING